MRVLSFNARVWWRDRKKDSEHYWRIRMEKFKSLVEEIQPDIICLQEMWCPATGYVPKNYKSAGWSFSHKIYIREDAPVKILRLRWRLRWFGFIAKVQYFDCAFMSVHSHWDGKILQRTVNQIERYLYEYDQREFLAIGDWNNEAAAVIEAFHGFSIQTPVRVYQDTFHNFDKGTTGEIDFGIARGLIQAKATILPDIGSDHIPILVDFL